MKILIAHNRYRQQGGEDAVVQSEYEMLKQFGHEVQMYERNNEEFFSFSPLRKFGHLLSLDHSFKTYQDVRKILQDFCPDVVHLHNIFFMITPAIYQACREVDVPVVQSQHNFRLFCSNGLFFRDGAICEECPRHGLWRGVRYGCYQNSSLITAAVVRMLAQQWRKQTWTKMVDFYITSSEFTRQKFIQGGIPGERIMVKPNFVASDDFQPRPREDFALFVGRLSEEKGVNVMLAAWRNLDIPLKIVGDGSLMDFVNAEIQKYSLSQVEMVGRLTPAQAKEQMQRARLLILPSVCYENFPRVVADAYACGLPIAASRLGSMALLVSDQKTGVLFEPGNAVDLAAKVKTVFGDKDRLESMSWAARQEYEEKYSVEKNHEILLSVYQKALEARRKK